jgi:hypothetical protein
MSKELLRIRRPALGALVETFRPALHNVIGGYLLAAVQMAAGGGLLYLLLTPSRQRVSWFASDPWLWVTAGLGIGLACGLLLLGFRMLLKVREVHGSLVHLCEGGLELRRGGEYESLVWRDIERIREISLHDSAGNGPITPKSGAPLQVAFHEARPLLLDQNRVDEFIKLAERLRSEAELREIPWEAVDHFP